MPKRTAEPVLWLLFSAGGMLAAMLLPALLLLFGVLFPLGWLEPPDHAHLLAVLRFPLTRLALLGLFVLALFHWAHRFRYTLYDGLQLKRHGDIINVFCFGLVAVGSVFAANLLLRVL
ncbi:MAG: fumarate reductase subunit FrdD [Gaiellaceae bacterium]